MSLTGSQRRFLRSLAHDLDPVLMIGHKGITEPVLKELDRVLEAHELIKVRLAQSAPVDTEEAARQLAEASGAHLAQTIGHVVILYREATDPEARRIRVPPPRRPAADAATESDDDGEG